MSVTSPENERARTKTWEEGRTECNRRRIRWTVAGRHPFRAPGPTHSIQDDDGSWEELPTLLPTSAELEGAYCFWNPRSSAAAPKLPQNAIQRIGPTAPRCRMQHRCPGGGKRRVHLGRPLLSAQRTDRHWRSRAQPGQPGRRGNKRAGLRAVSPV